MNKMSLKEFFTKHFLNLLGSTMYYVLIATLVGIILGILIGILLFFLKRSKGKVGKVSYNTLDFIINMLRSFPFYILIFAIMPFTRIIMGGTANNGPSFIVPLSVAAIPFFAKLIENALNEVEPQIIEAGLSLGLSWPQIIFRIVIKESMPSIVSGVTLGIITLFGYSALANIVGGSGFGAFAASAVETNDTNAMIFAVVSIIVIVELISLLGNFLYKRIKFGGKMKTNQKVFGSILLGSISLILLVSFISLIPRGNKIFNVGVMKQPGEPIINHIKDEFYEKTGYTLNAIVYGDFNTPNKALSEVSIDANLFQHAPYLNNYNKTYNTDLVNYVTMYDCVYGAYSLKIDKLEDLPEGAVIAVADDSTNLGRCLRMLEAQGLITLNEELMTGTLDPKKLDLYVTSRVKNIKIEPLKTSMIASKLKDKDCYLGLVNATFAISASLGSDELIFEEADPEHVNANILACRKGDVDNPLMKTLAEILTSESTKNFIETEFKGTIKPYFIRHFN